MNADHTPPVSPAKIRAGELQGRILAFMEEYSSTEGRPPTIREIMLAVGKTSTGHVSYHLAKLREAGKIVQQGKTSRGRQVFSSARGILIRGKIAAGEPLVNFSQEEVEWLELKEPVEGSRFALRVKGKSMIESLIDDGDIVIIEPQQSYLDGEIVVAQHHTSDGTGAATLKRIYRERNRMRLQPANSEMDPIFIPASEWDSEWEVQGRVVNVVRQFNYRLRR